jgi:trans-aconitate 2-methyltransferase
MLARAERELDGVTLVRADIADWQPAEPPDLVFSNAALHWLPDHSRLFPRLVSWLAPGGCLAVQMPGSFELAFHTAAREAASEPEWGALLPRNVLQARVHELHDYHAWLAPLARQLDLWETTYLHALTGDDPVTEWFRSTLLLPYLEALPPPAREGFLESYRRRVQAAYPKGPGGITLLPMRRLFIVATV